MTTPVFLGNPPPKIRQWIIDHYAPQPSVQQTLRYYNDSTTASPIDVVGTLRASDLGELVWESYSRSLENFQDSVIGEQLPAVGSTIQVPYKVYDAGNFVMTPWQVLGYNGSIPEYVKYINGNDKIFVRSVEENQSSDNYQLLKSSFVGSPTYTCDDEGTFTADGKSVASVGDSGFTYGATNSTYGTTATEAGSYAVPTSITVASKTYLFAGYNFQIAPMYLLPVMHSDGTILYHQQFDSERGYYNCGQNDWSTSMSRSWFNDSWSVIQDRCEQQQWNDKDWSNYKTGPIKGMVDRIESGSGSFFSHVMPTVNKIWTFKWNSASDGSQYDLRYRKDKSGNNITSSSPYFDVTKAKTDGKKYLEQIDTSTWLEHCVDKFWFLGFGHVNYNNSSWANGKYDTCTFSSIFTSTTQSSSSRIRNLMNVDGTNSAVARSWRLRSANSDTANYHDSIYVGYVYNGGIVSSYDAYYTDYGAMLPACTIC